MDALDLLIADHRRFRGLFSRYKDAQENDDLETMQVLFRAMARDLDVHTEIEEQIFYPALRSLGDEMDDMLNEGIEEHHVADSLLEEVRGMEPDLEHWTAKIGVMIENVEHHIDEEESDMFPKVRSSLDRDRREALAHQMEERKKALGAPVTADNLDLTATDLRKLASEQKIPGRSTMTKEQLAAAVVPSTR